MASMRKDSNELNSFSGEELSDENQLELFDIPSSGADSTDRAAPKSPPLIDQHTVEEDCDLEALEAAMTAKAKGFALEFQLGALADAVHVAWNRRMRTSAGRAHYHDCRIELNPRLLGIENGVVEVDGTAVQQASSFSMLLQKPDRYRITWEQMNLGVASPPQSGAAWNDGTGPWFYMSAAGGFSKMASDEIALGAATGVSGGAANTVPTYFFSFWTAPMTPASRITDPQRGADAEVDGEACYVVAGPSAVSKREVLFVSKEDFLIRRYEYSYEPPAVGRPAVPEMTDEQLDEALKAMGQDLTDESRERMREMVKTAMGAEAPEIKGGSVQIHRNVSTAKIDAAELKFSPPAGATETDSLFGGVFK